jgi:hypothetical protein
MSAHLYASLVFLHILLAIVWVGGAITIQIMAQKAIAAGPVHVEHLTRTIEWMGKRVFMPASGTLFLLGLWMAFGWVGWPVWIWIGVAGFAATFVTGTFFLGPESGRIAKLLEEKGAEDPETVASLKRILAISRIDLVVLVIVVWDMAYKPFQ